MAYREAPDDAPILVVAFGPNVIGMNRASGQRVWQIAVMGIVNRIHVDTEQVLVISGGDLQAVSYRTGEARWKVTPKHHLDTLLVEGDRIYVGGAGEVTALTLRGELLWHDGFPNLGSAGVSLGVPGHVVNMDRNR